MKGFFLLIVIFMAFGNNYLVSMQKAQPFEGIEPFSFKTALIGMLERCKQSPESTLVELQKLNKLLDLLPQVNLDTDLGLVAKPYLEYERIARDSLLLLRTLDFMNASFIATMLKRSGWKINKIFLSKFFYEWSQEPPYGYTEEYKKDLIFMELTVLLLSAELRGYLTIQ